MTTTVSRGSGPGNRWILPVILVLIIAAIVVGAILWATLRKSASGPTPTPRVVVVSPGATAGGATASTTARTGSTPLPGASPVPTVPGLILGMITHPPSKVAAAQRGADAGNSSYTFRLNPRQVLQTALPTYGFHGFSVVSPPASPSPTPRVGADHRNVIWYVVSYQSHDYTVAVAQPAKQGATGVWFIVTILPGSHAP